MLKREVYLDEFYFEKTDLYYQEDYEGRVRLILSALFDLRDKVVENKELVKEELVKEIEMIIQMISTSNIPDEVAVPPKGSENAEPGTHWDSEQQEWFYVYDEYEKIKRHNTKIKRHKTR